MMMNCNALNNTEEDIVILKAKQFLETDSCRAKALIITAQTLFPNHFGVQYEAYKIEKLDRDVEKSAKYFNFIISNFKQPPPELWDEVSAIASALRCPKEDLTAEQEFLSDMFQNLNEEVQHKLLMLTADHSEDTLEHCRLLLLLVHKFPKTISTYGPSLVETLLSAECYGSGTTSWVELLMDEVMPLITPMQTTPSIFPVNMLHRLFLKSIDFYMNKLYNTEKQSTQFSWSIWNKTFSILEFVGKQLGWENHLVCFDNSWNKENYYSKLLQRLTPKKQPMNGDDKKLLFCGTILFLKCLHEYTNDLICCVKGNYVKTTLIELHKAVNISVDHIAKRPKLENTDSEICIEIDGVIQESNALDIAIKTWDLMHSVDNFRRDFPKLLYGLHLDNWLDSFRLDMSLYRGQYDNVATTLRSVSNSLSSSARNVKLISIALKQKQYSQCFEYIDATISNLPTYQGDIQNIRANQTQLFKHQLHFLPLTSTHIIYYCAKVLIHILKISITNLSDLELGHLMVLMQLDRLEESSTYSRIFEIISKNQIFRYPLFQKYIVDAAILEEIMYLSSEQGGSIVFDIFPHLELNPGQRRMGTRHADKGVKEDFKQNIKLQLSRCNEPYEQVIANFITSERSNLVQCLKVICL
ncbi:integrator complex subunit 10-like [Ctenocephalides felis]|uniref:integrator complex subunit 10-like n=1 Tax=Ctenocephalides felis TaxID=7515 RepID=UPI000E6E587F|nr:integrator complex subunit 10-like [Ctenocephalides felis]